MLVFSKLKNEKREFFKISNFKMKKTYLLLETEITSAEESEDEDEEEGVDIQNKILSSVDSIAVMQG